MISLGKGIPWTLFNESGIPLFRKGFIIRTEDNLKRLAAMKLYYNPDEKSAPPVQDQTIRCELRETTPQGVLNNLFREIEHIIEQVKLCFDELTAGEKIDSKELQCLASQLQMVYHSDPDLCLGAIHLSHHYAYSSLQPVFCTLLCEMAAQGLGLSKESRNSLASAALTANLGMYSYHDRLIAQTTPLTDAQLALLRKHPEKSVEILKSIGVRDPMWLRIVLQHHEREDGSGYPAGLTQKQISMESSIIGVADTYLAHIMPRSYRDTVRSREALRKIYKLASTRNNVINLGFIKQITIYPPGTFVKLKNGEIAIVIRRNIEHPNYPDVVSILKADGHIPTNPVLRNVALEDFAIQDVYEFEQQQRFDTPFLWEIFCMHRTA